MSTLEQSIQNLQYNFEKMERNIETQVLVTGNETVSQNEIQEINEIHRHEVSLFKQQISILNNKLKDLQNEHKSDKKQLESEKIENALSKAIIHR